LNVKKELEIKASDGGNVGNDGKIDKKLEGYV